MPPTKTESSVSVSTPQVACLTVFLRAPHRTATSYFINIGTMETIRQTSTPCAQSLLSLRTRSSGRWVNPRTSRTRSSYSCSSPTASIYSYKRAVVLLPLLPLFSCIVYHLLISTFSLSFSPVREEWEGTTDAKCYWSSTGRLS